ncbi:MAG: rhomboid family intramembrane serine protease, partial [Bacteroidales bacterium]|nr:rhomboid family intramembrane serine protease [Bacteroidales bacterium]
HMLGAVAGVLLAARFRAEGPQRPAPFYEIEEEEEEEDEENAFPGNNQIN